MYYVPPFATALFIIIHVADKLPCKIHPLKILRNGVGKSHYSYCCKDKNLLNYALFYNPIPKQTSIFKCLQKKVF